VSSVQEWQRSEHAKNYLECLANVIPHRTEGETVLLELIPLNTKRVLDLGTGDGRIAGLIRAYLPESTVLATDFSPTMLESAKVRFADDPNIEVREFNFENSILELGKFDAIVSSFAIHHVEDPRKQTLYSEVFQMLNPGGIFANMEHVSSPTEDLHDVFLASLGMTRETEDKSNRCSPVELQLGWLREIGFDDVECYWKWRELALLAGVKR